MIPSETICQQIIEFYTKTKIKVEDIIKMFHISPYDLYDIIGSHNIPRRGRLEWKPAAKEFNIGNKIYFWMVISAPFFKLRANKQRLRFVKCRCDCGYETDISVSELASGTKVSCGCKNATPVNLDEKLIKRRLYYRWVGMRRRCSNPKYKGYHIYGGKGIKVCEEWNNFENFEKWAHANGFQSHLALDRIDPNGNYEPSNCEWVTLSENTRRISTFRDKVINELKETNRLLKLTINDLEQELARCKLLIVN